MISQTRFWALQLIESIVLISYGAVLFSIVRKSNDNIESIADKFSKWWKNSAT